MENAALYSDSTGIPTKLSELMTVDAQLASVVGKELLEKTIGKKTIHASIAYLPGEQLEHLDVYSVLSKKELLEALKADKQKLGQLYSLLYSPRNIKGQDVPFVLADDNQFYSPNQVVLFQIELDDLPGFLKVLFQTGDKKLLHPDIAGNEGAVNQLESCGLEVISEKEILRRTLEKVSNVKTSKDCPECWQYPDDFIRAQLLLLSKDVRSVDKIVTADESIQDHKNTFAPGSQLDWEPLSKNGWLAPGYYPIHQKYFQVHTEFGMSLDQIYLGLGEWGVHGFRADKDDELIEHSAYQIAISKLQEKQNGHAIKDVHDQTKLGYDLKCVGHCNAVFEVKGMAEPKDVSLEESEWSAALQNEDFVLVCVYNLPTQPNKVGYKETTNVRDIGKPVEKARVPKSKWLSA